MSQNKSKYLHKHKPKHSDKARSLKSEKDWEETAYEYFDDYVDKYDSGPTVAECRTGSLVWLLQKLHIREAKNFLEYWFW